jgi:acetyl-CoA carboxylase carboxyl transferase subunit alpha
VTLIDTPGAYPGIGAEKRGQAEAIAMNLREMARLRVPLVSVVIGEGGSGGALALGVTDRILMLEHAIYSVISPEGCAAILWRSAEHRDKQRSPLKLTSADLHRLGVVDEIIPEPPGGAMRTGTPRPRTSAKPWSRTSGPQLEGVAEAPGSLGEVRGDGAWKDPS